MQDLQTPDQANSLLSPIGYRNDSCGYCHNKQGSQSKQSQKRFLYYATTTSLQPRFYQSLLDRGWRRSGTLLYKPDQRTSCCPQYTIRLDSEAFHANKDQRQSLNRFNKHILGDDHIKEATKLYPLSREQAKKRNNEFNLVERIHESEKRCSRSHSVSGEEGSTVPPEPAHDLVVTLEPDNYTEEKYTLFENYQRIVHKEPPHRINRHGFKNFLCSSPLPRSKETFNERERQLGSFHQCYRINGELIAIGVLDLLPQCVSAVYFMYHENVHSHNFGKIGALREIALAKEEGYRWWYAGFYIHNCIKMRYKADYNPQYILDPVLYAWDPLDDQMKKKLDAKKFVSMSLERSAAETEDSISTGSKVSEIAETTNSDGDSDEEPPVLNPALPLFRRSMPGILTRTQLLTEIDLDHIRLEVHGEEAETCDLVGWESSDIDSRGSIKGFIAELVAAVGTELGAKMVVALG